MSAAAVPVSVALPAYHHTYEITSGAVALAGMAPTFVTMSASKADIADMPLLDYVAGRLSGDRTMTAVPVFPARAFVHSWIHVRQDGAGRDTPTGTAAVYALGLLAEGGDQAAEQAAEIVVAPRSALHGRTGLRPLFDAPAELERADYARTGVYPILSVIAVRTELIERERWLGSNVFRAFEVARRRYFARLQDIRGSRAPIPSVAGHLLRLRELFGPELWPYGVEQNRATLEAFVGYAAAQGLLERPAGDVTELFADVEPFVDFTDGV